MRTGGAGVVLVLVPILGSVGILLLVGWPDAAVEGVSTAAAC